MDLSKLVHGFVKVVTWICKVVTWSCQSCSMYFPPFAKQKTRWVWPRYQSLLKLLLWTKVVEWVRVLNAMGPFCLWQCLLKRVVGIFVWIYNKSFVLTMWYCHLQFKCPFWYWCTEPLVCISAKMEYKWCLSKLSLKVFGVSGLEEGPWWLW